MTEVKAVLYAWCGKQKKQPAYETSSVSKGRGPSRFKCEVRVDGFDYVAMGNSTNKKDAMTNAARDFCQFLVRTGQMSASELPQFEASQLEGPAQMLGIGVSGELEGPPAGGDAGASFGQEGFGGLSVPARTPHQIYLEQIREKRNQEEMAQSESVDFNADIHGGWTIDNCKGRLNMYLQQNKIPISDYTYKAVGPDHQRGYTAELSLFVRKLNRTIHGREQGSNKKTASASCALSLVRQLFHLGEIEEYSGVRPTKKSEEIPEIEVAVAPDLYKQLTHYLESQGVQWVPKPEASVETPVSLLPAVKLASFKSSEHPHRGGVVSWSPPQQNWNPWTGSNIVTYHLGFSLSDKFGKHYVCLKHSSCTQPTSIFNCVLNRSLITPNEFLPSIRNVSITINELTSPLSLLSFSPARVDGNMSKTEAHSKSSPLIDYLI